MFTFYLIVATILMVKQGVGITPDRYLIVLLVGAVFLHRGKKFIHDFFPFILLLIAYDFLRGFADDLNGMVHYIEPIRITQFLFNGHIPTVDLQHMFYTPGTLHWYDYLATYLYLLHFALPLGFAAVIWLYNRKYFIEFMVGLSVLSYAAFISYLIFPLAPPWLASQHGLLPPITKIFNVVLHSFPDRIQLPTIYRLIGPNLVAAIPSMHTAYATLVTLFAVKFFGKLGLVFLLYTVGMWITIVYLGEHYVIDIAAGVLYAVVAFKVAHLIIHRFGFINNL